MITITTVITILIVILVKVTICCSWICKQNYIVLCVKMRPQSIPSESCHESQWERLTNYIAIPQTSQVTISGTSRCNMESAVLPPCMIWRQSPLPGRYDLIWMFPKIVKSSILIGFSIISHPFWGTTIFGNSHMIACIEGALILETVQIRTKPWDALVGSGRWSTHKVASFFLGSSQNPCCKSTMAQCLGDIG